MSSKTIYYLDAFFQICRGRTLLSEGQPAPLNLVNIKQFIDFYGEPFDREELEKVIFALDDIYVEDLYKKIKVERSRSKNTTPTLPRRR